MRAERVCWRTKVNGDGSLEQKMFGAEGDPCTLRHSLSPCTPFHVNSGFCDFAQIVFVTLCKRDQFQAVFLYRLAIPSQASASDTLRTFAMQTR